MGATAAELAHLLHLDYNDTGQRFDLAFVLKRFRAEVPSAAWQVTRWDKEHNRAFDEWRYDFPALRCWLDGRSVHELAVGRPRSSDTPLSHERREKGVRRAVAFLQFVLMHVRYSPILFGRFLNHPPSEGVFEPCEEVRSTDIKQWAKRAGVSGGQLWQAKRRLPIKHRQGGPERTSFWRLTEPVVIPQAPCTETHRTEERSVPGQGAKKQRKERQRPANPKHQRWWQWKKDGMSYNEIVIRHKDETGETVTRDAVIQALRRLKE